MHLINKHASITLVSDMGYDRIAEIQKYFGGYDNCNIIDFYTMDMNELTFIAKHRILPVPTILVLVNSKVILRLVRPPEMAKLVKLFNNLSTSLV